MFNGIRIFTNDSLVGYKLLNSRGTAEILKVCYHHEVSA